MKSPTRTKFLPFPETERETEVERDEVYDAGDMQLISVSETYAALLILFPNLQERVDKLGKAVPVITTVDPPIAGPLSGDKAMGSIEVYDK